MDYKSVTKKYKLKPHPQEKSNFLSDLFYCWTIPIFRTGIKRGLSEEDIYQTLKRHNAKTLGKQLQDIWHAEVKKSVKPSLWRAIWNIFKWQILWSLTMNFVIEFGLKMIRPLALGKLMGYYLPGETAISENDAILYASIIVLSSFLDVIVGNYYFLYFLQLELKIKSACSSLLYQKSLKLSKRALGETTLGQIMNLLSTDLTKLSNSFGTVNGLVTAPLQAILVLYLLYYTSGLTSLVGFGLVIGFMPVQIFLSKKSASYRLRTALKTDERIRHMNEIISGIQVIKIYTWEIPFVKVIDAIRRKEMYFIKVGNYLTAISTAFSYVIDKTSIFLCILVYVLSGNNPTAQYVYVVTTFYNLLIDSVSYRLAWAFTHILQANVSVKRLEKFLLLEEMEKTITNISLKKGLSLIKASAKWSKESTKNTLTNVNFAVEPEQIVAVIGPIGGGKSSLLQLCLGELPLSEGSLSTNGRISYANQEPWLFASTVKQNILFGEPMIADKYNKVLRACALEEDITQFPYGDNTIVGERGILLSGGQKARINLARAVYRDADIYLLDDPLSAVDASVGKQIFNNCIKNYLKSKSVVLVTHQVQYLNSVDKIYLIVNGAVTASGNYYELQASGEDFTKLLKDTESFETTENVQEVKEVENNKEQKEDEETRASGKVAKKIYGTYLRACGTYFTFVFLCIMSMCTEVLTVGSRYFLTFWVNLEQKKMIENLTDTGNTTLISYFEDVYFTEENCIYMYSGIIGLLLVFSTIRSMSFFRCCMAASVKLHDRMFNSVVNAAMRFFYTNSSGRVLNRFSKDIGNVDESLPHTLMDIDVLTFGIAGSLLAIFLVNYWSLIPGTIVFVAMYFIRIVYITTSRAISRLISTTRSPIFSHLSESVKGLSTIRAYDAAEILQNEFDDHQNVNNSIFYLRYATNRAFAIWIDSVCLFYMLCVTALALSQEIYGGTVGFVITQSLGFTGMFKWGIRQFSELENEMTSVERVVEYIDVPSEKDTTTKPASHWPEKGRIEMKSVSMRYSPDDPHVLKDLNVIIHPKEKVGIVGRTGAGKSSLISVLFRLVDFEGNVYIDNVDTKTISFSSLRSKISIIPQEPVLFSGNVRYNLDPFEQYTDDQIWNVLDKVKLKQFISELTSGLYSNLAEGGSNFSVGQKQLVCLARALLKNNKILILDEATANVDPQTDELLQQTIRTSFADCTVLTIAHRLHTIMDSDKILVMNDGYAAEFDQPYALLQKKGVFYDLVLDTGTKMSANLTEIAKESFNRKKKDSGIL